MQLGETIFWIFSILLYTVGDLTLTTLNISAGKVEVNPAGLEGVVFFKVVAILVGVLIYRKWKSLVIPATFALLGVIAIVFGFLT